MSRADKEAQARIDGMYYAVKRIDEVGMDEFRRELAWRGRSKIGITELTPEEMRKTMTALYEEEYRKNVILTMLVLKDEFGFDTENLRKFNARCNTKTEGLIDEYVDWADYERILKEENGIVFDIKFQ